MKRKRSQRRTATAAQAGSHHGHGLGRRLAWGSAVLVVAGIIWWMSGSDQAPPAVPEIEAQELEPAVTELIAQTRADVISSPRTGQTWGALGMALRNYEFIEEAIQCFRAARRFDERNPRWPYWLGLLAMRRDPAAALAHFETATQLSADRHDAPRWQLALHLEELGRMDEAARHYLRLLQLNSNHTPALLGLARIDLARGHLEGAAEKLRSCADSPFTEQAARGLLAVVEKRLGRDSPPASSDRTYASVQPDTSWPDPFRAEAEAFHVGQKAWSDRAQSLLDQGRVDDALVWIERLTQRYPQTPGNWLLLARAEMQRENCVAAEQALRRVLQLKADSVNGHSELGIALLCQERYAEAISSLTRAIQLKPDHGWAHFNLGFALARTGRGMEAIPTFKTAIRYNPDFIDPYITLADLLHQSGRGQEAMAALRDAARIDPADERVRVLMERIEP